MAYQGEQVGELAVTPRHRERLSERDQALLVDLAHQAGMSIRAASVTADLRRSREWVVAAREEERRRLHRDLHDGLGPTLASLCQRLEVAEGLVAEDPEQARRLLAEVRAQTRLTIADLRRLVYALRPPALDDLGLVGALDEVCRHLGDHPTGMRISVDAAPLPPLPAGIEVAAYRIVVEAVTNALRHSGAGACRVALTVGDGTLVVRVADDGSGTQGLPSGGGLTTMRERAEEVGGTFTLECNVPHGTVVTAHLPLYPDGPLDQ